MNLFDRLDFICFRRQWHGVVGQFAVFADGIQIIRSFPKKEMWRRSFSELVEMRKITSPNLEKEKCLELKFADGSVGQVETMKRRLVLPLASLNSSGSNFSLSLGKYSAVNRLDWRALVDDIPGCWKRTLRVGPNAPDKCSRNQPIGETGL